MRRFPSYEVKRRDNLGDPDYWNKRFKDIDERLHARELDGQKIDEAVDALTAVALQRLNDTFTPVVESAINRLADVGRLFVGESTSELTIGLGEMSLVVSEDVRLAYIHTDYITLQPQGDGVTTESMTARVVTFDRITGVMEVDVVVAVGEGTYSVWKLGIGIRPDLDHATRTDNPHAVTAAQVGAYSTAEADAAIAAAIDALKGGVGSALDTLEELAAALDDDADFAASVMSALAARAPATGYFFKADPMSVVFVKTGAGTINVKAGTKVEVNGAVIEFATATAVTMPALTAGTDYAIYVCDDGEIVADASFTAPTGYTTTDSRQIGGFHYAPGGNATGTSGGDTTPAINEYSLWDLKWRPACPDPRGMTLVNDSFWVDIYLTGVDHHVNGTSKYNVTIADGSSPPKIPTVFGGNGSTTYSIFTWYEANEVMQSHGKDLLSQGEFAAMAQGTTEASSGGTDPVSTILRQAYTSKYGVMLATGNMWVWGRDFSTRVDGTTTSWGWKTVPGGKGNAYTQGTYGLVAARLGGNWAGAASSGSRASSWFSAPWDSSDNIGARGRCDHLRLV